MTRRTFVWDSEMETLVQIRGPGSNHYEERSQLQIIRDIEPYRAAGADIACDGKRPVISGRRQHREFLARNGYVEIGNEVPRAPFSVDERARQQDRVNDLKRAAGIL